MRRRCRGRGTTVTGALAVDHALAAAWLLVSTSVAASRVAPQGAALAASQAAQGVPVRVPAPSAAVAALEQPHEGGPLCASRPAWMIGPCAPLSLGSTSPVTTADDERNGTLAIGGNSFEVVTEAPFFAATLRAVSPMRRCAGTLTVAAGNLSDPARSLAFAQRVNLTADSAPATLTNVAGSTKGANASSPGDFDTWTVTVYLPYTDEDPQHKPCEFTVSVDVIAQSNVSGNAWATLPLGPGAPPAVAIWTQRIAEPAGVEVQLFDDRADVACTVAARVAGPQNMWGDTASWAGGFTLNGASNASRAARIEADRLIGFRSGEWALELRLVSSGDGCTLRVRRAPLDVRDTALPFERTASFDGRGQAYFSLPSGPPAPPHAYAGASFAVTSGECRQVALSWMGDTFSGGAEPLPWFSPSSPAGVLLPYGPPTWDPSVTHNDGPYLLVLDVGQGSNCSINVTPERSLSTNVSLGSGYVDIGTAIPGTTIAVNVPLPAAGVSPPGRLINITFELTTTNMSRGSQETDECNGTASAFVFKGTPGMAGPVSLSPGSGTSAATVSAMWLPMTRGHDLVDVARDDEAQIAVGLLEVLAGECALRVKAREFPLPVPATRESGKEISTQVASSGGIALALADVPVGGAAPAEAASALAEAAAEAGAGAQCAGEYGRCNLAKTDECCPGLRCQMSSGTYSQPWCVAGAAVAASTGGAGRSHAKTTTTASKS